MGNDRKWVWIPWLVIIAMVVIMSGAAAYAMVLWVDCGPYVNDIKYEVNCTINWWSSFKKIAQIQTYTLTTVSVVLAAIVAVKEIFPNEAVRATTAVAAAVSAGLLATFKPDQTYQRLEEAESLARVAIVDYDHSPDPAVKGDARRLWSARMLGEAVIHEGSRYIKAPQSQGWPPQEENKEKQDVTADATKSSNPR
ncbi:hypothetical protein [Azospirillum sp. sgz301742]